MNSGIIGGFTEDGKTFASQDVSGYLDEAKAMREMHADNKTNHLNIRPAVIIPDIVAIDIWNKYGIDVFDPAADKQQMALVIDIVKRDYPELRTSNTVKI